MADYGRNSPDAGASYTTGSDKTRESRYSRGHSLGNPQAAMASALGSPLSIESDSPSFSSRSGDPTYSQDSSQVSEQMVYGQLHPLSTEWRRSSLVFSTLGSTLMLYTHVLS